MTITILGNISGNKLNASRIFLIGPLAFLMATQMIVPNIEHIVALDTARNTLFLIACRALALVNNWI